KWDSFIEFLEGDSSMYWITGKAGSGKSTLIKFINEHPQTKKMLCQWTGQRQLLCASFYFFYKGSNEQKTEIGLVRSLLHWILSERRELILPALKDRFLDLLQQNRPTNLTLPEAKRTLRQLLQDNPTLCFFFTIDGLDEFDPEVSHPYVNSVIELTKMLCSFKNVKVAVSSRQLPEFEYGFAACPRLKVHDLTRDDICHYTRERLESHQYMQTLIRRDPVNAKTLIESITTMSSGVFLWVRVVTESLLQGLANGDSITDLQERLEGLPSDLQELYEVMLLRVDPRYRRQTCELLQLVYYAT
ncbi:hypothetical protein M426DRAFT_31393, partial [Hypoxylon sp. CI-4A]